MKLRSQTELEKETHFKPRNPLPILGSFPVSTAMAKISAAHTGKLNRTRQLWWLAIAGSVALYLVTSSSLYKDCWAVEKYSSFEKKNRSLLKAEEEEEVKMSLGEQAKGKQHVLAVQHIFSSSSGSRPLSKDSVISLDHGDPTMYEPFWHAMGEQGTIVIPGWQTMSYFSDVSNICWFLEPEFAHEIRRLHKLVGNAVAEERHIVVGTGSTQLFQAALYALSPSDAEEPMRVVSATPYYSSFPVVTDYLRSGLFRWAGDANSFNGDSYIEIICSPNNPDGFIKHAVLNSQAGKTVHDLAYYWPQYTAITGPADHDIMLFTVSKSTGHAGTRLGWALVKDRDVAMKMSKFIELNTIGVSKDSQVRAAKIMKVISDGYELPIPDPSARLFDYGKRILARRWERLREVAKTTGMFSLPEYPSEICNFTGEQTTAYPAFAWLKCEKKEAAEDCESFLKSYKILTRSGRHFGVQANYARVSMLDLDETFDLFIERLISIH